jgi:hypothetical protein
MAPGLNGWGQDVYKNQCFSDQIRSAQVYPTDNPLGYPIIDLHGTSTLEFHFDLMNTISTTYRYAAIHCDQNWQMSDIDPQEYLQGFATDQIDNFDIAFNTRFEFVHYQFTFPNDMMKPRYSGNYAIVVFSGTDVTDKSSWILTYRMLIYEEQVMFRTKVKDSSIISQRYKSQEIDFDLVFNDFRIIDPLRDINVSILQNMDWNTSVNQLKPIFIKPTELSFDYNEENNFSGGSEWRQFEVKSLGYASLKVEDIVLEDDGYNIYLRPDIPTNKSAYSSQNDLNGNWLIKNDQASNSQLEAEYIWVHFKLVMPEIEEGQVRIDGRFDDLEYSPLICTYDKTQHAYVCKALMKQGYYNYRYLFSDKFMAKDDVSIIEGNHNATENDYHIVAYMYDRNLECDRIIGITALNSTH